jgi:hypothetical protein
MERLLPVARDRQIKITMPRIESAQDVVSGLSTVMAAVAAGEITPSEGERMARLMDAQVRAIQIADAENHSSDGAPSGRLIAGTFSLYSGIPEEPPQALPQAVDSIFRHGQPPVFPVPPAD